MSGTHNGKLLGVRCASPEVGAPDVRNIKSINRKLDQWLDSRGLKKSQAQLRNESFARMRAAKAAKDHARKEAALAASEPEISTPRIPTTVMKEKIDAAQVGPRLREARIAAGRDAYGCNKLFRERAGISSAVLSEAETGKRMTLATLDAICGTLNLRRDWALSSEGEMWQPGGATAPPARDNQPASEAARPVTKKVAAPPMPRDPKPVARTTATAGDFVATLRARQEVLVTEFARIQREITAIDQLLALHS